MKTFNSKLNSLKIEALDSLNRMVSGTITLPDGNRAFDLDDGWLIVGKKGCNLQQCPLIRDKRDKDDTDSRPLWDWDIESICDYADQFVYNK